MNWLSFIEDITKTILVCFMGHSVVTLPMVEK